MSTLHKIASTFILISLFAISNSINALSCGDDISSNVTLNQDLHCTSGYTALNVVSNNLTIDLNGHTISGSAALAGISIIGYSNISIKNGSILDFFAGVNASNSNGISINEVTFFKTGFGLSFHQVNNSEVTNNDFIFTRSRAINIYNTQIGETSSANTIKDNEFYKTNGGIQLCGAGTFKNNLLRNLIWKSTDFSIHLISSSKNTIDSNEILDSSLAALRLNYSSNNSINHNILKRGSTGVTLQADGDTGICESTGAISSDNNQFNKNSIIDFDTGMIFGLGNSKSATVSFNTMYSDKIYDNDLGVRFLNDAWFNDLTKAVFSGNTTNVVDSGTGNSY